MPAAARLRKSSTQHKWCVALSAWLLISAALAADAPRHRPSKSGIAYASDDVRRTQADDFTNPGMLWVAQGGKLWQESAGTSGKSCATCHGNASKTMRGVAGGYPRVDAASSQLVNLEGRINRCRVGQQGADLLPYESEKLLALTAYVAHQSRGMPTAAAVDDHNRAHLQRGRAIFYRRQGQLNLACTHCHEHNVGRKLLAETLSEGHGNAYPIYRLEWQTAGSLQRRLRACYFGVRAEMPAFGSDELLELELYLAWRATGLSIETPGVRR